MRPAPGCVPLAKRASTSTLMMLSSGIIATTATASSATPSRPSSSSAMASATKVFQRVRALKDRAEARPVDAESRLQNRLQRQRQRRHGEDRQDQRRAHAKGGDRHESVCTTVRMISAGNSRK